MEQSFPYFYFVLAFVNISYFFETYLDYRQHKKFRTSELPGKLVGLVTPEVFAKSQRYGHDKSSFGFINGLFNHILSLSILWYGILPSFWSYCNRFLIETLDIDTSSIFGEILLSCVFLYVFGFINMVLSLPFSLYRTFVIEEKHGFNKQTLSLFFTDLVKSLCISLVFLFPIMGGIIYVIHWGGEYFYLYVCGFIFFLQIFLITIYPIVIQPLFNKVEPLPVGPLREKIEALAKETGFPLTQLYQIDGSKRSGHSNAYFYGFWNNKRIVLYDTLIASVSETEVVAVLAHELGHYFLNHTIYNLAIGQVQIGIIFYLFGKVMYTEALYREFGFMEGTPIFIGLLLFQYIYSPVDHITTFIMNMYIRYNEFQADAFSVKLGYGSELKEGMSLIAMIPLMNRTRPPAIRKSIDNGPRLLLFHLSLLPSTLSRKTRGD